MFKEFKAFAMRGSVLDMAVGIIIGAAFGRIITSFVSDIIMPPLGLLIGKVDFSSLFLNISGTSYPTLAQYSADHPDCIRGGGVVCHKCGTKAARAGVSGRGDIYRCSWCEDELFRIDHKVEGEGVR